MQNIDDLLEHSEELTFYVVQGNSKKPVGRTWTVFDLDQFGEAFYNKTINLAIKCGQRWFDDDKVLCVLDVDCKNGAKGFESLKKLEDKCGELPDTFTVESPSGGRHFYFWVEPKYVKRYQSAEYPGLDLLSNGYVIAPFSVIDGQSYKVIEDHDFTNLTQLPDAVLNEFLKSDQTLKGGDGDSKQISDNINENRNENLTREAGGLRRIGYSPEAMFHILKTRYRTAYHDGEKEPLSNKEINTIAKSIGVKAIEDSVNDIWVPEIVKDFKITEEKPDWRRVYGLIKGDLKIIADEFLEHSRHEYPQFAIASALMILATVFQGTHCVESRNENQRGKPGQGLSLFFYLLAPSGAGKDTYLNMVEEYISKIHKHLNMPHVGSSQGFREALYCYNSRALIIDEMQDFMKKITSSRDSYMSQIGTDLKELANSKKTLKGVITKGAKYPEIKNPRVSCFGVGTTTGFTDNLDANQLSGGLTSRFLYVDHCKVSEFKKNHKVFEEPKLADKYKKIFEQGVSEFAKITSNGGEEISVYNQMAEQFHDMMNPKKHVMHEHESMLNTNSVVIHWTEDAEFLQDSFIDSCQAKREFYLKTNPDDSDVSPASLVARAPMFAERVAALQAISRGQNYIDKSDIEFGIAFVMESLKYTIQAILNYGGKTSENKLENQILHQMKKHGGKNVKRRFIQRGLHATVKDLDSAILSLLQKKRICAQSASGEFENPDLIEKIPKGCTFWLAEALT